MRVFRSDCFEFPLPRGHTFPLEKYSLLRRRVVESGLIAPDNLIVSPAASGEELERVHHPQYVRRVKDGRLAPDEIRRIGLPWSTELVERSRRSCGGTIAACRAALADGCSVNLAGGTHHASAGWGAGYCVWNDCAVAARAVQAEGLARSIVIIDCDVHQGDGTAAIFACDRTVTTVSIHAAKNYPIQKEKSDLDIALQDRAGDAVYLGALEEGLRRVLSMTSADLAVYLAGADPYFDDRLGRLSLTKTGLRRRDRLVLRYCRDAGIPIAITMAGGYARQLQDTVDIHFQTVSSACESH